MNFRSVTINLLLTTLSGGVLLQTLEAQAASISFDPWTYTRPTVTGTNFSSGNGMATPRTLKAFAQATSTDTIPESSPPQFARTIISLSNFFTVIPEIGEENGDHVRGFLSGRLQGAYGSYIVSEGDVGFFISSVVASVNAGGFQPWNSSTPIFIGTEPGSRPINEPINREGILTIGQRYQLNMRLDVFAATLMGNSQAYSDFFSPEQAESDFFSGEQADSDFFSGDAPGLTVNIRTEPVPEPLTILGSATGLGFAAFFKRQHSKKQKKS
jgi:hypothetical protein